MISWKKYLKRKFSFDFTENNFIYLFGPQAFGTQEMVEYLCQRGADVNKGQRSSSLHYAACFGRPQIGKKHAFKKYEQFAVDRVLPRF